jgi:hypothetical protein
MHLKRYLAANAVIVSIVGASLFDIIRDEEHWPFSQYPMFNRVTADRTLTRLRLYGVTHTGEEFALIRYADVFPFDQSRLSKALGSIRSRGEQAHLDAAVANCLERYERQRLAGWHHGPPLAVLRLYVVKWTLNENAANVHAPDARRMVAEVVAP